MKHPFSQEGGLPFELVMSILLLISPDDFLAVSVVCKL